MSGKEYEFNFDLNYRKGDIGFIGKISSGEEISPEIVCYQRSDSGRESCYTLAFFEKTKEGYDLRTVGTRLVDAFADGVIDNNLFIDAIKYFHKVLDAINSLEKTAKETW
ncbi:MAG: hypothetical protein II304_06185 [Bacteroidales bacterium]|nr:hypothetical protein [Bacteroidales bacterium]